MSYKKGKDIKVPFDCLWHCYTRKFETVIKSWPWAVKTEGQKVTTFYPQSKPEEFEKW